LRALEGAGRKRAAVAKDEVGYSSSFAEDLVRRLSLPCSRYFSLGEERMGSSSIDYREEAVIMMAYL
jgi:hypothetical protein